MAQNDPNKKVNDCKDCEHWVRNNGKPLCLSWTKTYGHIYSTGWDDRDGYDNKAPWCNLYDKKRVYRG